MNKIEYDIKLNDSGRPCIDLPRDHEDKPEDKFFVLELTRYLLQNIYTRRSESFDSDTSNKISDAIILLQQLGDEMAILLWENMKLAGDAAILLNNKYHIQVDTVENRDKLIGEYICYNNKLFKRQNGLKVLVTDEMKIYELINNNWNEII